MIQLSEHFRLEEKSRHSEWLRRRQWFIKAQRDLARKEDIAEKQAEEILALATEAIMATQTQIKQFETKLDAYDAATVSALMDNQEMMDAVRAEIEGMLSRAYVIEDGRRVFKSEDGSFVIDESGDNVSRDELDFELIPDDNPSAETYMRAKHAESELLAERDKLHKFQEKVDAAREKIAGGEISKSDLDELDAELAEAMPTSVARQLSGVHTNNHAPIARTAFSSVSLAQTSTAVIAATPAEPSLVN